MQNIRGTILGMRRFRSISDDECNSSLSDSDYFACTSLSDLLATANRRLVLPCAKCKNLLLLRLHTSHSHINDTMPGLIGLAPPPALNGHRSLLFVTKPNGRTRGPPRVHGLGRVLRKQLGPPIEAACPRHFHHLHSFWKPKQN